ncbi:MAG: hypothetical protein ACRC3H_04815 [Lachnospiraceae bacterium]
MPRFCKIKVTEEELITIRNIRILKEEQKLYAGIPAKKHWCEVEHNGVYAVFSGVLSGGFGRLYYDIHANVNWARVRSLPPN